MIWGRNLIKKDFIAYAVVTSLIAPWAPLNSWAQTTPTSPLEEITLKHKQTVLLEEQNLLNSIRGLQSDLAEILENLKKDEGRDISFVFKNLTRYTSVLAQIPTLYLIILSRNKLHAPALEKELLTAFTLLYATTGAALTQLFAFLDFLTQKNIDSELLSEKTYELVITLKDLQSKLPTEEEKEAVNNLIASVTDVQFATDLNAREHKTKEILAQVSVLMILGSVTHVGYFAKSYGASSKLALPALGVSIAHILSLSSTFLGNDRALIIQKLEEALLALQNIEDAFIHGEL